MARHKAPKEPSSTGQNAQPLVLLGDLREAPIEIHEGGRTFRPVVALWVRADDGYVVGQFVDEPGHSAETLVRALHSPVPVPGQRQAQAIPKPSRVVLFNEELAREVNALLAPFNIEVMVSRPFEPFEDLFADFLSHVQQAEQDWPPFDLPEDILRPLVSAAERLWRAKPWEYMFDYPPFALVPRQSDARPLFASILGARQEVFGVALYASLEDYRTTARFEVSQEASTAADSPAAQEEAATEFLKTLRQRAFLVSFERKDEVPLTYRDQVAVYGWSRRLSTVPTFAMVGEGQEPGSLRAQDASDVTLAVDALTTFCQNHRAQLADADFPIRDTVEASLAGRSIHVDVSVTED